MHLRNEFGSDFCSGFLVGCLNARQKGRTPQRRPCRVNFFEKPGLDIIHRWMSNPSEKFPKRTAPVLGRPEIQLHQRSADGAAGDVAPADFQAVHDIPEGEAAHVVHHHADPGNSAQGCFGVRVRRGKPLLIRWVRRAKPREQHDLFRIKPCYVEPLWVIFQGCSTTTNRMANQGNATRFIR